MAKMLIPLQSTSRHPRLCRFSLAHKLAQTFCLPALALVPGLGAELSVQAGHVATEQAHLQTLVARCASGCAKATGD